MRATKGDRQEQHASHVRPILDAMTVPAVLHVVVDLPAEHICPRFQDRYRTGRVPAIGAPHLHRVPLSLASTAP